MLDLLKELLSKKHEKGFLAKKVVLKCNTCGYTENPTYYELLKDQQIEVMEPANVPNPYILDGYYEEEVPATPIKFKKQCKNCGNDVEAFSPVPLEYILTTLQSTQPDDIMYG
ncbi:MAG: hypothetical protein P1P80_09695 [ANME-2 cluster archaeon]|nr:hypothetical protein [ANME-2 cluster archaeon]